MKVTTYQTYDLLGSASLSQPVTQPGVNSLTCLSCHDGQTAVDAIINMPGSGRYNVGMETSDANTGFLNSWVNPSGIPAQSHGRIGTECAACHSPTGGAAGATDFTAFIIGTDLRNDHRWACASPPPPAPAPTGKTRRARSRGWPTSTTTAILRADANEIRLYNTGDGYEVSAPRATILTACRRPGRARCSTPPSACQQHRAARSA